MQNSSATRAQSIPRIIMITAIFKSNAGTSPMANASGISCICFAIAAPIKEEKMQGTRAA